MERKRARFSQAVSGSLALVLTLVAACGADVSNAPADAGLPDAGPLSAEDFAREYARLQCEEALRCESRTGSRYADLFQAECHPANAADDYRAAQIMAVAAGRAEFDPAAAATCLEVLAAVTCYRAFGIGGAPGCGRVFTGTVPLGGACTTPTFDTLGTRECTAGTFCSVGATCPGTCVALPAQGGLGAVCERGVLGCDADHYCREGVCAALLGPGVACASIYECQVGLICGPDAGLVNVCVDPSTVVAPGGPCLAGPGVDSCPAELVCICDDCLVAGTCVRPAAIGAACSSTAPCGQSARCVDGTCRPIAMPEGDCSTGAVCPLTHACDGAICRALPTLGEACVDTCFESACLVEGDVCGFAGARPAEGDACGGAGHRCEDGLECRYSDGVGYRCRVRC